MDDASLKEGVRMYKLIGYIAMYWGSYISDEEESDAIQRTVLGLFGRQARRDALLQVREYISWHGIAISKGQTLLHFLANTLCAI